MKNIIASFTVLAISAATLIFSGCGENKAQSSNPGDVVIVRAQRVAVTDYAQPLEYSGTIASATEAKLSFKIGGIISKIYVKEGDHVRKGQLLATLDLTEIDAQVQQAKQNVEKANRDLTRIKNLFDDTAATLEQYQNAQTQRSMTAENFRIAQFNQQYAQIRATDEGTIIKKIMDEGELASSGAPVLIMNATSSDDWVVRFGVSDRDWAQINQGDVGSVQIDAYPATVFEGVVNKIAGSADPVSGTYEIELKVLPRGKKFAGGLFATIRLNGSQRQKANIIPIEALTEADGKTGYVYILNHDKITVTKKQVQIIAVENDKLIIRGGLENEGNVITDGASYLTGNSKVKLVGQ